MRCFAIKRRKTVVALGRLQVKRQSCLKTVLEKITECLHTAGHDSTLVKKTDIIEETAGIFLMVH